MQTILTLWPRLDAPLNQKAMGWCAGGGQGKDYSRCTPSNRALMGSVALDFRPPLVGREEELGKLVSLLEDASAANGRFMLLAGEAGVGKTRLVEELKRVAKSRGFVVLSGYALHESLTPYMPFMEALRTGGLEHLLADAAPRVEG